MIVLPRASFVEKEASYMNDQGRLQGTARTIAAQNPSERWKWDFMYQDVPPTKFVGEPFSTNFDSVIPLKEVT